MNNFSFPLFTNPYRKMPFKKLGDLDKKNLLESVLKAFSTERKQVDSNIFAYNF